MSSSSKPLDEAARQAREAFAHIGLLAGRMEELAGQAAVLADDLEAELRTRGQATADTPMREQVERQILEQWRQMAARLYVDFMSAAIVQGPALMRQPIGPRLQAVRGGRVQ